MRFGAFEVVRVLGSGAMAAVYEARHPDFGSVALKVAMHERYVRPLESEHAILHRFAHPGLPEPLGFVRVAGQPTLIMSLLPGAPFAAGEPRRSARETLSLAISLLALLDHVHRRGAVHCDVKRQNVLVGESAELLDFGIARDIGAPAADASGQIAGTPAYMPPEVLEGGEVGPATDLYSFGVLLYRSLTGRFPFPWDPTLHLGSKQERAWLPPTALRADLPAALDELLYDLFAPHPAERPGSGALRARLRALAPLMPLGAMALTEPNATTDTTRQLSEG